LSSPIINGSVTDAVRDVPRVGSPSDRRSQRDGAHHLQIKADDQTAPTASHRSSANRFVPGACILLHLDEEAHFVQP
jgi:hypothetical protein